MTENEKSAVHQFSVDVRALMQGYTLSGVGIRPGDYGLEPSIEVIDALSSRLPDDVTIIKGGAANGYLHFERRK